jgi:hypothetical protein
MKTVYVSFFTCLLVITANTVSAQSRKQPLRFTVTPVDAKTHKPRTTFSIGESVAVRVSLTNQSRNPRSVIHLQDASIDLILSSMQAFEDGPKVIDSYYGGTGWARSENGMTTWGSREPRKLILAPGQTTSIIIEDLGRHFFEHPFEEGTYTLTAEYIPTLRATLSVRIIVDEAKSIPILEQLAAQPVQEGRDSVQKWATSVMKEVRHPSISGYVRDTEGRPLNEVDIEVTGTEKISLETRNTGGYRLEMLKDFGTYTITPEITYYDSPGEIHYTLEPASKTISLINDKTTKITDINFTAKRIRVSKNVASEDEGAKARASSTVDWNFEPENVINDFRFVDGWYGSSDGWNDGTPNVFPDWIEVDFGRVHRINWINVFTLPDDFRDGRDREINEKFSLYGITDFDVQYWNGRAWQTVPGGAIRGNKNIWRMISFPIIATDKIRVVVRNSIDGESRITEIEAFHLNDLPQTKLVVGRGGNAKSVTRFAGHTNSPIDFRIIASDRDGKIEHYELEFGDTTYEWHFKHEKAGDKPLLTHSHVYKEKGTYEVKLKVVDDSNEAAEAKMIVTITDPPKRNTNRLSQK